MLVLQQKSDEVINVTTKDGKKLVITLETSKTGQSRIGFKDDNREFTIVREKITKGVK